MHFERAFQGSGVPRGLVQSLMIDHDMVQRVIQHESIAFVSFTGSVSGGHAVYRAVANRFIDAVREKQVENRREQG